MKDISVAERLSGLFTHQCRQWRFPETSTTLPEPQFTGQFLYPKVDAFIRTLQRNSLTVRADGATAPRSLGVGGMNFVPDVEIVEFEQRYLAIEVKFLRDTDASGSFAKAIGQAAVYRALGFPFSHVLILDCRTRSLSHWGKKDRGLFESPLGVEASLFASNLSGEFVCLQEV